jgi:hypothetical protein
MPINCRYYADKTQSELRNEGFLEMVDSSKKARRYRLARKYSGLVEELSDKSIYDSAKKI